MSRVPPRTPPVERLLDRNKFVGRIDGETDRRLRAVEKTAEDAKGTTVTQTINNTTTDGGSGSIPGSPTQYSAAVVVPSYPITISAGGAIGATHQTFVIDDDNNLGFGAGALVVARSNLGVRVYAPGNLNNYTDFNGLGEYALQLVLMPGAVLAASSSNLYWWRVGSSTAWSSLDSNTQDWVSKVGDTAWWLDTGASTGTAVVKYMGPDLVVRSGPVAAGLSSGSINSSFSPEFRAGAAGQWVSGYSSSYRPNDTTTAWSSKPSGFSASSACVDSEGLWEVAGASSSLSLTRPDGTVTWFNDVMPFATAQAAPRMVPLGNRNFFWATSYVSGSTHYPTIWNISPTGSTLLWEGTGGTSTAASAQACGRAGNGDVYARFGNTLVRITPS